MARAPCPRLLRLWGLDSVAYPVLFIVLELRHRAQTADLHTDLHTCLNNVAYMHIHGFQA